VTVTIVSLGHAVRAPGLTPGVGSGEQKRNYLLQGTRAASPRRRSQTDPPSLLPRHCWLPLCRSLSCPAACVDQDLSSVLSRRIIQSKQRQTVTHAVALSGRSYGALCKAERFRSPPVGHGRVPACSNPAPTPNATAVGADLGSAGGSLQSLCRGPRHRYRTTSDAEWPGLYRLAVRAML
jgi:hypothetical protein